MLLNYNVRDKLILANVEWCLNVGSRLNLQEIIVFKITKYVSV